MDFKVANTPEYLQMELIELQCSSEQRIRFQNMELIDYYKQLSTIPDFSGLVVHAKKIACSFGSTLVCEQLFSEMKFTKNPLRNRITGSHLHDVLRITTSGLKPDIASLAKERQHQTSH